MSAACETLPRSAEMSWALIECDVMASSTEYLITLLMSICGESIGYLLLSPALRVYLAARKLGFSENFHPINSCLALSTA